MYFVWGRTQRSPDHVKPLLLAVKLSSRKLGSKVNVLFLVQRQQSLNIKLYKTKNTRCRAGCQLTRISPLEVAFNIFSCIYLFSRSTDHFSLIIFVCACVTNIYIIIYPYLFANLNENSL